MRLEFFVSKKKNVDGGKKGDRPEKAVVGWMEVEEDKEKI